MKIYVVSHKKYWFPQIDNYVPIQVGNGEKFSLFRDDTDDNISNKNKRVDIFKFMPTLYLYIVKAISL